MRRINIQCVHVQSILIADYARIFESIKPVRNSITDVIGILQFKVLDYFKLAFIDTTVCFAPKRSSLDLSDTSDAWILRFINPRLLYIHNLFLHNLFFYYIKRKPIRAHAFAES